MEERWLRWFIGLYKTQMLHQDFYLGKCVFIDEKIPRRRILILRCTFPQHLKDLLELMRT